MRLRGTIRVPSDKSITHRAYLLSALASGESTIVNPLRAEDCQTTLAAVRTLGATVVDEGETVRITGTDTFQSAAIDCGNSGTTIRLLSGILAGKEGTFTLSGDASLSRRPMGRVVRPLSEMGADISGETAPLVVHGRPLREMAYRMPIASAQVKSAIMLAALTAPNETTIEEPVPSRDHTERMLPAFGGRVDVETTKDGTTITVWPGKLSAADVTVPADPSSAAFFWGAAAIVPGSQVTTTEVCLNETRIGFLRTLERMGAVIDVTYRESIGSEPIGDVTVSYGRLNGVTLSGRDIPLQIDELPLFALVASQAGQSSTVRDAGELRVKESDRIATVVRELSTLGVQIEEREDGFVVHPSHIHGGEVEAHGDHRLAMMLQIARLLTNEPVVIRGEEAMAISYPAFRDDLKRLLSE